MAAPLQISTGFAFWQRYCSALQYWASAKLCGVEQRAPRHLYSTGRSSLWALAHMSSFASFYVRQKVSRSLVPPSLAPDPGDATVQQRYVLRPFAARTSKQITVLTSIVHRFCTRRNVNLGAGCSRRQRTHRHGKGGGLEIPLTRLLPSRPATATCSTWRWTRELGVRQLH